VDLPIAPADPVLTSALAEVFDLEGKVARALEALGPMADRDVVLLDGDGGRRQAELEAQGARVRAIEGLDPGRLPDASADAVVGCWTGLGLGPAADRATLAALERVLRPGGRVLLVEDYGRDDMRQLYADREREVRLAAASDRRGPMLGAGYRTRTLHCYWTFPSVAAATSMLQALFPKTGAQVAASMSRPRLEHKVAVFHRSRGG
jgi:SAM-dependent methyltransferase